MKRFQQLIITNSNERLIALLDRLKEAKGIFSYKRNKSAEYARNIFHKENTVACFSTNRKTLGKASVWIVITNGELNITNITPGEMSSLSIDLYNIILNEFYQGFVSKYIDATWKDSVRITDDEVSLSDILSEGTYMALERWERCCNHTSPITNESDENLWFEFIRLLHNDGTNLSIEDFGKWLSEDKGWSSALDDIILELELKLEYSLDLLNFYDGSN